MIFLNFNHAPTFKSIQINVGLTLMKQPTSDMLKKYLRLRVNMLF